MSPILFIILFDYCGGLVRRRWKVKYVDDLALTSETEDALQRFIDVWHKVLTGKGMRISRKRNRGYVDD